MLSSLACASVLAAMSAFSVACDDANDHATARPNTGAAVSGAVRRVSENLGRALATPERATVNVADAVRTMPEVRVIGEGSAARVEAREDEAHRGVQATQTPEGWAMTWGDEAHTRAVHTRL